jgi:hypothetical protein
MPIADIETAQTAARVVAIALLLSLVTVVGVTYGVVVPVLGHADPPRMAQNILGHETLFRVGIAGYVLYVIELLVLAAGLYMVLGAVSRLLALLAAVGRLLQALVWLVVPMNLFAALRLLSQPAYAAFPPDQRAVLARLFLTGFDQYYVALLFWSLGSTVAAVLWLRSSYVPRWLAVFGIVASAWAVACTCCLFVDPKFGTIVDLSLFDVPLVLFEIAVGLRLMARGLRPLGQAVDRPKSRAVR